MRRPDRAAPEEGGDGVTCVPYSRSRRQSQTGKQECHGIDDDPRLSLDTNYCLGDFAIDNTIKVAQPAAAFVVLSGSCGNGCSVPNWRV